MYRKLSAKERQERRDKYRQNPIYKIVYTPLWKQRGEDLSPEDVWEEANNLAYRLKSIDIEDCEIKVAEVFDDLCEKYSCFSLDNDIVKRNHTQAEHSAMMVFLVTFLLLANVYPDAKGHPYLKVCQSLADVASNINGYTEIYEEARAIEDEYESHGKFIEVADFIEQISIQEEPLSDKMLEKAHRMFGQFVEENKYCDLPTMYDNERMIARVNDKNNHCLQPELDMLRKQIMEKEGNEGQNLEYRNIIFAPKYEEKVSAIRHTIYPFVSNGPNHINPKEQRQWLAVVEPLKIIEGLLIKHEDKPKHKNCTDREICQQLREFYGKECPDVDFDRIPKSLTEERNKWKKNKVGLTFESWHKYASIPLGNDKYKPLAKVAERVYGEIKRVIEGK